jgi:3-oxoacyl-[acyl-carrier protein] reductase
MFTDFEAIQVGDSRSLVRTITEADVRRFVEMTGDDNPLHVNRAFAESTSFRDIVVHGMLGASFISTVIGTKLPGPGALWVSQNMEFLQPVRLGDELTVTCTVLKKYERERLLELETVIANQNRQTVLAGTGKVKMLAGKQAAQIHEASGLPRVALVTGGTGGIGRAICLRLAKEGFHVVINYRNHRDRAEEIAALINAGKTRAVAVQADIATQTGAETLHKAAMSAFGGIGVVVNNASSRVNPKPLAAMEWSDLQSHMDVQVKGAFLMIKACAPEMMARKSGRIVNITSQVTQGQPSVHWTAYAAAKASLAMMSRYFAAELGVSGITVNCVSPGMTETPLIGDIPEKVQMMVARQTPLRRLAVPADVAAAVAYLVSEDAGFVTGHTLCVNGGMGMQ